MKKILFILISIVGIILLPFGIYKGIEFLDYKNDISNLEKYSLLSNEKLLKSFTYNKHNYVITMYNDGIYSWNNLNILLKDNQDFYVLKNIKGCDTVESGNNIYIKGNEIYIHCIGKKGNIDKYIISNTSIDATSLKFNYDNTPNISELHIIIDKIDNENIYLSSPFKVNNTISDDPKVKCSFKDNICRYY